jgi:DnaJ-domain-containing protein 1
MDKTQIPTVLKSHFLRLYQIALADDDFSALELKMLYEFAEERGILKEHLDEILLNPVDANNLIPEQVNEKLAFLYDFTAMIWADEIVTDDERSALEKYIKRFGFLEKNIEPLAEYLIEAVKSNKTKQEIINALND